MKEINELTVYLKKNGLSLAKSCLTKQFWRLPEEPDRLLVVFLDDLALSGFRLTSSFPRKGEIAAALTHFWLTGPLKDLPSDLVPSRYRQGANAAYDLQVDGLPELPLARCLVVKNFEERTYDCAFIQRGFIGGSVYNRYRHEGLEGNAIAPRLPKWWKLNQPLFTPKLKKPNGGFVSVNQGFLFDSDRWPDAQKAAELTSLAYETARSYAFNRDLLLLDAGLRAGRSEGGDVMLIGEAFTHQYARFAYETAWEDAVQEGKEPKFLGRSHLERWVKNAAAAFQEKGLDSLDPGDHLHRDFMAALEIPDEVIIEDAQMAGYLFRRLTGYSLAEYQKKLGV